MAEEHVFTLWSWGPERQAWGYTARCSCGVEVEGRWSLVQAQAADHLNEVSWENAMLEAEEQHS